jgi:hypothetical protein
MPESHIVLAPLGDIDLDTIVCVKPERGAVSLVDIGGAEFVGKISVIRKASAFSRTPALTAGGLLCA